MPYEHVPALLRESVALLNPSLFEGWSTTVEEGKSPGKHVLMSDREELPARRPAFVASYEGGVARTVADA